MEHFDEAANERTSADEQHAKADGEALRAQVSHMARQMSWLSSEHIERSMQVAIATVLHKLGETSITIELDDVLKVAGRQIKVEKCRDGGVRFQIV